MNCHQDKLHLRLAFAGQGLWKTPGLSYRLPSTYLPNKEPARRAAAGISGRPEW